MDIFIEEIIFFDLTHYFIDVEAENEKEAQMAALDDHKLENLNFRERVWVSRLFPLFLKLHLQLYTIYLIPSYLPNLNVCFLVYS